MAAHAMPGRRVVFSWGANEDGQCGLATTSTTVSDIPADIFQPTVRGADPSGVTLRSFFEARARVARVF